MLLRKKNPPRSLALDVNFASPYHSPLFKKHHRRDSQRSLDMSTLSDPSIPKIIASNREEIFNLLLINHNVSAWLVEFINGYSDLLLTSEIEDPNSFDGVFIRSGVNVASNPTRTEKSNLASMLPWEIMQSLSSPRPPQPRIEGYHSFSGVIAGTVHTVHDFM